MNNYQLNIVFEQFETFLASKNQGHWESMDHPFFIESEYYKLEVYHHANKILDYHNWNISQIGSGEIQRRVINAIEIKENNLVRWEARFGESSTSHYKLTQAVGDDLVPWETALYNLFRTNDNKESMEQLIQLNGKKYDFVAYLFFIKNKRMFLPIASTKFDKAFELIGIEFKTSYKCSWLNYMHFIGHIQNVKHFLQERLLGDVTLLDAHSFLWAIQSKKTILEATIQAKIFASILELGIVKASTPKSTETKVVDVKLIDFADRQKQNIEKGNAAELIVMQYEHQQFANQPDLLKKISNEPALNPTLGYDIDSVEADGTPKQIEVKATESNQFFLSSNELRKSQELPNYYIYLVRYAQMESPFIEIIKHPKLQDNQQFLLTPANYIVRFAPSKE